VLEHHTAARTERQAVDVAVLRQAGRRRERRLRGGQRAIAPTARRLIFIAAETYP
jgi:hypothetical protein